MNAEFLRIEDHCVTRCFLNLSNREHDHLGAERLRLKAKQRAERFWLKANKQHYQDILVMLCTLTVFNF